MDTLNAIADFLFIMLRTVKIYFGNAADFKPENYYELSEYTVNENGEVFDKNNKRVKECKRHRSYKSVELEINGVLTTCNVHRIVACTFRDICGEFNEVVNHLDENKLNNCASNLRWCTNKENLNWGTIKECQNKTFKETIQIKNFIKSLYKEYDLKYTKNVKVKRLKTRIIINDALNDISLTLLMHDVEIILKSDFNEIAKIIELIPQNDAPQFDDIKNKDF